MPVTHFSITLLPSPSIVVSSINGVPIVLNTLYPIAEQANLSFERAAGYEALSLFSLFKYKTHNQPDNIISNEAVGFINWSARLNGSAVAPSATSTSTTILNNETVKLIDLVNINETVEFIDVESIDGVYNWKLNGSKIYPGQRIQTNQFSEVLFTALSEGGGPSYSALNYKFGNPDNPESGFAIKSTLNIDTEANLLELIPKGSINYSDDFDDGGSTVSYNVVEETIVFEITGGFPNKNAVVEIAIACPFLALNSFNQVVINNDIIKNANETFNVNVLLDSLGKGTIKILHYIVEDAVGAKTGQTDVTLLNINGNTAVVSATNFTDSLITNI